MEGEGKRSASFTEEFFDQPQVYRSLQQQTVEQAAHPSAHSNVLDEQDVYRDLPGSDFSGAGGALPGFLSGQFDPSGEQVYRSLPAFAATGMTDAPSYRSMDNFGDSGVMAAQPGVEFTAAQAMVPKVDGAVDSVLAAAANIHIAPPAIPRPPFALSATHYASLGDASTTITTLGMLFSQHEVDATYKAQKCKFKCVSHVEHEKVAFKVSLFTRAQGDVVVEFQKRQGGALHFKALYEALRAGMAKHKLCVVPAAPAPGISRSGLAAPALARGGNMGTTGAVAPPTLTRCFAPPPLPIPAAANKGAQQQAAENDAAYAAIGNLLEMAGEADGAEMAREAAKTLAVISESTDGISHFDAKADDVIPRIVALLMVEDDDIQRCAAAALANVCERLPHRQSNVVQARALPPLVGLVTQQTQRDDAVNAGYGSDQPDGRLECVRHCTRALANLCGSHADAIENAGGVEVMIDLVKTLKRSRGVADKVMAENAGKFMASLGQSVP